jgi:hypothetical protein
MSISSRLALALLLSASMPASGSVFATVHGVVHDSEHRPIANASVMLQAADCDFTLTAVTDSEGIFELPQAPIGVYRLQISASGFTTFSQPLALVSGTNPIFHASLSVASATETVVVDGSPGSGLSVDSVTPETLVTREMIDKTPGASRTTGMEMITDYVPGAYLSHNMLHIGGGHQTSWLIDGIAIPNMRIASNVGPQIDPKDIAQIEVQRGSYAADVGDRTYGVFDVLPRNGFERNRSAEVLLSFGNLYTSQAQLSLGDHSEINAWYLSLAGSRSNYGLATPVASIHHDSTNSQSGFFSLLRNKTPKDQLRLNAQYRQDYFQVPYDPYPNDWEQASGYYNSYGLRDGQTERDSFLIGNWVHTVSPRALFMVAPFYHFNQSNYDSSAADSPVATTWHQTSNYAGAQADMRADVGSSNFTGGLYSFYENENDLFGLVINDQSFAASSVPNTASSANVGLVEFHVSDHLRVGRYITLLGGMRFSTLHGGYEESAAYPRIGATVEVPRLHWVLRGFYGHFFQPAPVQTVSSGFLNYVTSQKGENAFVNLPSERDEEHQFGIQIPYKGWVLDVTNVRNRINNFLDHSNVGESNIYFPIAVDGALVRAWELTLSSPRLAHFGQFHLAYSNQIAEQRGNVIGGFICGDPSDPACNLGPNYTPVDHDQRNTLSTGFTAALPRHTWFASNIYYGSGFTNGLAGSGQRPYEGNTLPSHTTFDISAGRSLGESWKVSASALNVTNHRVLLDNSITIGGFHFNDPRTFSAELSYHFHF